MLTLIEREIPKKPWMTDYSFILVQDMELLKDIIDKAIKSNLCAFDLESSGLDTRVFNGKCMSYVVGYCIAFEPKIGYYIPIRHSVETENGHNLPPEQVNPLIERLINECVLVGHNMLKFDAEMIYASEGISFRKADKEFPYHDTYILARLAGKMPAGLKHLSKTLLKKEMLAITDIVPKNKKKQIDFGSVSPFEGCTYAASDSICTLELFKHPEIMAPMKEQSFIYNLERKLFHVVRKMERNKVKLDLDYCRQLDTELLSSIKEIEESMYSEVSQKTNGQISRFLLDSPEEVSKIFFEIYDMCPKPERGKKGFYKTDDKVLEVLAPNYPIAKKMQNYRTTTKFHRTYIRNMIHNVDEEGYLKFNFSSLKTDSGRFATPGRSSEGETNDGYSGVNVQSAPARYDKTKPNVRKCLSCEEDEVIAALDWSGVEIRIAANMSQEPIWVNEFVNGRGDIHLSTASIIFDKTELEISKLERNQAKGFNFQTLYGGGPKALADALHTSMDDAKEKRERYFGKLTGLKGWIRKTQRDAEKNGYCLTMFRRKRPLPEFKSEEPRIKAMGARKAINTPIQGTAADLMKIAMLHVDNYIEKHGLNDVIQMLITMHDELVFRVKKDKIDIIADIAKVMQLDSLTEKINWPVKLKIDVEIGDSWDVQYEYVDMLEFLKVKKDIDTVSYLYQEGVDYEKILEEYDLFLKEKKKAEAEKTEENSVDEAQKGRDDFKIIAEQITKREDQDSSDAGDKIDQVLEISSEEDRSASASQIDAAFSIIKNLSLSDLPIDAYRKLKRSFYNEEVRRIVAGSPSEEDDDIETILIVHKPLDDAKKNAIRFILDSCPGRGKIKFLTQGKEELHSGWKKVDIMKAVVMSKILNL